MRFLWPAGRSPKPPRRRRPPRLGLLLLLVAAAGLPEAGAATECRPGWSHEWARGAVFYEVFVRSFADSNGDGIGDLNGLTSRLDYLNDGDPSTDSDLGVDALWLMPVFPSPSYHGYDVTDYEAIEPDYGSAADFDRLIAEAHRRGLRVILDLVINHSSREHPWFADAASGVGARRRHWYVWRGADPGWTQPWGGDNRTWHRGPDGSYYYGIFWVGMPDLNFDNSEVREEMKRIARAWLARGVDGFRLDATRHLFAEGPGEAQNDRPATHAFLREFAAAVRAAAPGAILVGENWTDTPAIARYYGDATALCGGDELPMNFNFPLAEGIVAAARDGRAEPVLRVLDAMRRLYPETALDAPFLTNHDQVRVASQLAGDGRRLRLASAILMTLPGAPFVYYGEEIGMANGSASGDPAKRTPMAWSDAPGGGFTEPAVAPWIAFAPGREISNVASQTGDPASLLAHYRRWIGLRRGQRALRAGSLEPLAGPPETVLAYRRTEGAERLLVLHNLDIERAVHTGRWVPRKAERIDRGLAKRPRSQRFTLGPGESAVWRLP